MRLLSQATVRYLGAVVQCSIACCDACGLSGVAVDDSLGRLSDAVVRQFFGKSENVCSLTFSFLALSLVIIVGTLHLLPWIKWQPVIFSSLC